MSDPVTLNFVSNDVLGGEWLQWADGFSSLSDLVDQTLEQAGDQPVERLIIAAHGAENTKGFVVFDVDLSGNELIVGATVGKTLVSEVVGEQFGRLEGHWADEAIIEMRVCEFGTEMNGTNAMQALADAAGVPVTAPMDTISSLGLVGGVSTNWKTVYPTSWDRPVEIGFWRGEPTGAPPVPFPPPAAPLVTTPHTEVAGEPADPPPSGSGSGEPMPVKTKVVIGAGATAAAVLVLMGLFFAGGDDAPAPIDPVAAGSSSETATDSEVQAVDPVETPAEENVEEPAEEEPPAEEPSDSESTTASTPPQIPANLAGAKILEVQDLGFGCYNIIFEGDTEGDGSAESISQSVLFFQASLHILSDGIRVSGTYLVDSGAARATAIRVDDANSKKTDDGKGTVTVAESGDITAEWLSPGVLQLEITGVEIPHGTISVQVVIQETADGEYYSFVPDE